MIFPPIPPLPPLPPTDIGMLSFVKSSFNFKYLFLYFKYLFLYNSSSVYIIIYNTKKTIMILINNYDVDVLIIGLDVLLSSSLSLSTSVVFSVICVDSELLTTFFFVNIKSVIVLFRIIL